MQPLQRVRTRGREAIEPLVPFVFLAPLADQQALALETPEQRIQRAFVNREAEISERLAKRVAMALGSSCARTARIKQPRLSSSRRFSKMSASMGSPDAGYCSAHTVWNILYVTQVRYVSSAWIVRRRRQD